MAKFNENVFVITNHHILPTSAYAKSFTFGFFDENETLHAEIRAEIVANGFFFSNEELSFAIFGVHVDKLPIIDGCPISPVDLSDYMMTSSIKAGTTTVQFWHHAGGHSMSYSDGLVIGVEGDIVQYGCQTEAGSSGAMVYDQATLRPVALHKGRFLQKFGAGGGVAMSRIVPKIAQVW